MISIADSNLKKEALLYITITLTKSEDILNERRIQINKYINSTGV